MSQLKCIFDSKMSINMAGHRRTSSSMEKYEANKGQSVTNQAWSAYFKGVAM